MPLTDIAIKKAKPGAKPAKMSDEKGLYLLVNPTGSKLWRWKYRVDGAEKLMALGNYPDVSLTGARDVRDEARKLLATGIDPMARRKSDDVAKKLASEHSFTAVAGEWWAHWKPARSERHATSVLRRLEADVFPAIGARPVSEIKAPELVAMVKTIAARGALDIAKRALQTTGQVFCYAIAHGCCRRHQIDPPAGILLTQPKTPRAVAYTGVAPI